MTSAGSNVDASMDATQQSQGDSLELIVEHEAASSACSIHGLCAGLYNDRTETRVDLTADNLGRLDGFAGPSQDHTVLSSIMSIPCLGNDTPWAMLGTVAECDHAAELGCVLDHVHETNQYLEGWLWAFERLSPAWDVCPTAEHGDTLEGGDACMGIGAQFP